MHAKASDSSKYDDTMPSTKQACNTRADQDF